MIGQTLLYRYTPGSTFIVRIAGLPMKALRSLRFEQTTSLIADLLEHENELRLQAEPLSEALHSAIGATEDKQTRWHLIAIRRAIYQVQLPKAKDLNDRVWASLPEELASRICSWVERMQQWLALLAHGQTVLETEWAEKRQVLQALTKTASFQHGIILASKDLYTDFLKWSQTSSEGTIVHADRQTELGLFMYLSRMATKTSPFSTFMSSGRGYWVSDGPVFTHSTRWQRLSSSELSWTIAHRIAYELASWPEIRSMLNLRVNSSVREEGSVLRLLGWKKGEAVIKLTNSPTLQLILQTIRSSEASSYESTVQAITQVDIQRQETEIRQFLDRLIKIGLLELDIGIPDQSPDYLGQLLTYLQSFRDRRIEDIACLLQKVHHCLQQYKATALVAERFALRNTIHATLESIYQQLALNQRGLEVPTKNAFYENSLIEAIDVRCSLREWRDVLDDLSLVQRLSALYDAFLPTRLVVAAFFADHYGSGACVSLLRFYEDFCHELSQPGGWRPDYRVSGSHLKQLFEKPYFPFSVKLAELEQVVQLRRDFHRQFLERALHSSQVIQLDRNALRTFVTSFPSLVTSLYSLNFYAQMLTREGVPHLVLNEIGGGFGRSEGRHQFLERQLNQLAPSFLSQGDQERGTPLPVDILGVFGSNANLRTPQTLYEITYPGVVSARTQEEQIPLSDLDVVHDPQRNCLQLVSRRLQKELLPAQLGLLADFLRPPMHRFLFHLFGQGAINPFPQMQITDSERFNATLPVQAYPRTCLGKLIIARATWAVGVQQIPKREKGTPPFAYMLKVQRWIAAHALPQECFIHIPANLWRASAGENGPMALMKDRKPLYIDFSNYLSIMMFEQMTNHAEQMSHEKDRVLFLQEALPGQEDLVFSDGKDSYVSEFIIELTRTGQRL